MTETSTETETPETPTKDSGALDKAFEAFNPPASSGEVAPPIPFRKCRFWLDPDRHCRPGVYAQPFELTVREVGPLVEMDAAARSEGEALQMGYILAKASIIRFNGTPIPGVKKDFLWETLNTRGRGMVAEAFAMLGGEGPDTGKDAPPPAILPAPVFE